MGTRASFWALADHAAAREFGKRHYGFFVAVRFIRATWLVWAALLVVGCASGVLVWSPELPRVEIRIPDLSGWVWIGAASGVALVALWALRKFSIGFRMFLFRIGL
jgi:hypothetical protein